MERQVISNKITGDSYYQYKHTTGLTILLYPMKGFSSAYALFGTNYGSIDMKFKTEHETDFTLVPAGIAHFLEHKLFESEDGDAFTLFSKTGASANAFTSFDKTCYLFSTTDNFKESLEALVTFVQDPYFTVETVNKEQGIIGQEIKMYQDDPSWRVMINLLGALYHNNPVRIDIAGTKESIAEIDKDLLYKCYNAFYNPSNMVICIAGNFNETEAAEIIEKKLKNTKPVSVVTNIPEEPETVFQSEVSIELSVSIPLFEIGYKEAVLPEPQQLKAELETELILSAIAGKGSELYSELYNASLINETFDDEAFSGRGFFASVFAGESRDPYLVMEKLQATIDKMKETGISNETFMRIKKAMYGGGVLMFNNVPQVAHELVTSHFSSHSIYDSLEIIKEMTLKDVNNRLRETFSADRRSISIVNPIQ